MAISSFPQFIRENYEVHEWKHASAILFSDFPEELQDIIAVLTNFRLLESHIRAKGGRKSDISSSLDKQFYSKGWKEKGFHTKVVIDDNELDSPTHKVDCYKNHIALEVEWNNKDPFYDRDLNNFRLLFELRAISVGIIVTRCSDLQDIFDELGKGESYGSSTTHMKKLLPKIEGGGGGGCPVIVFGITKKLYKLGV